MPPDDSSSDATDLTLKPQLGLFSAVATGLAAIIGTGIYFVIAPAAAITGPAILLAFLLAAFIAYCNAMSSVQLAAVYPHTGGTYEYANRMIGPWAGFIAGWMFVVANTTGTGVIALSFAYYLNQSWDVLPPRPIAVVVVLIMTVINMMGIRQSSRVVNILVLLSVACLLTMIVIGLPQGRMDNFTPFAPSGAGSIFHAAALLFFAYTGYSRIATLVEEVRNPARNIPLATVIALSITTTLYLLVAVTAIAVTGGVELGKSSSPLAQVMITAGSGWGYIVITMGALLTTFNSGLTNLLGNSRVAFAMGRGNDLPKAFARLSTNKNPWLSVLISGIIAMLVAAFAPFLIMIAISSLSTLIYYAITNLSALRLSHEQRTHPRILVYLGLIGCIGLVLSLSPEEIGAGIGMLVLGVIYRIIRSRGGRKQDTAADSN
jgi:basic amino acid/polyamine antiporter, APA family